MPTPNFVGYRQDPSTTPTLAQFQVPTINTYGADAKIPVVYKANVSYTHFFTEKLKASLSGYMNLGRNNYMYVDRNMVQDPFFRLANEDNRGYSYRRRLLSMVFQIGNREGFPISLGAC